MIFPVWHGVADAEAPEGLGDEARSLTAKARASTAAHFASLAERIGTVSLVLTSPLVRTIQTAQLLSTTLKHEGTLRAHRVSPAVGDHRNNGPSLIAPVAEECVSTATAAQQVPLW